MTFLIFTVAKRFMTIRVSPEVELAGLDMDEFGSICYPDFVMSTSTASPAGHASPNGESAGIDVDRAASQP